MSNQDSTQGKFRKASKKDSEQPQIEENEVRIKGNLGNVKRYVDYACGLLQKDDRKTYTDKDADKSKDKDADNNNNDAVDDNDGKNDQKNDDQQKPKVFKTIVLKATGRAINKAVTTAEVVKRRIAGLHQDTKLETLEIVDVWEPTEEGLKTVETTRRVASITITLSLDEVEIEKMKKSTGYQSPLSADSVKTGDYNPGRRFNRGSNRNRGGFNRNYNRGGFRRNPNYYGNRQQYGNRNYSSRGGYGRRGGGSSGGYYGNRNRQGNRNRRQY